MASPTDYTSSSSIRGPPSLRLALLTFSLIGLQFTWGIEMTYCTPYLLQLGLTKSKTSLVWIAGPLSGLIMQPVVGAVSDRWSGRWGRRRPFMLTGSLVVGVCLGILGWTAEIVGIFMSESDRKKTVTILVAVLAIYAVDFAINAVQACCRSLIVDTLPLNQQQRGGAWAARMSAAGHVVGYVIGSFDLVGLLPDWVGGDTQFKKMVFVSVLGLWASVGVTCWAVPERRLGVSPAEQARSVWAVLPGLWRRAWNLPPRVQAICWAQFWVWIGWFPFLFFSSTWVGETYYRYEHKASTNADEHDALGNIGRLGSLALVTFSVVTFASSMLLPYLVRSPDEDGVREKFTPRPPPFLADSLIVRLVGFKPDLVTAWMISNLTFAAIMFWAPVVRSLRAATTLVALCGIPWSVSCWAPFAEIGREINKMGSGSVAGYTAVRPGFDAEDDDDFEMQAATTGGRRRENLLSQSPSIHDDDDGYDSSSTAELSGVYLGILNVWTTLPQFVGTFISWLVFSIFEPSGSSQTDQSSNNSSSPTDGAKGTSPQAQGHEKWLNLKKNAPNAIAVCLFIGALCAVVAGEAARRLRKIS